MRREVRGCEVGGREAADEILALVWGVLRDGGQVEEAMLSERGREGLGRIREKAGRGAAGVSSRKGGSKSKE